MDFAEGKETLTVATILDECRLQGRFDACYPRQIDIAFELLSVFGFVIEILNAGSTEQNNPRFFALTSVDK
jgi:hypothetical protein